MANNKAARAAKKEGADEARYTARQLIKSARFASIRDVLEATLDPEKKYSIAEAEKAAEKHLKGTVK